MDSSILREKQIWILVGTRPELIKQAAVYRACVDRYGAERVALVGTGQHRELLTQSLDHFGLKLDVNLGVMQVGQGLNETSASVLQGMSALFRELRPQWLVVQGDTTSAAMAAMAAFHSRVRVAHNEAGLRSYDLQHPFPEEANRRWISVVADKNFAPTEKARLALLSEGVAEQTISVVGNSGIDALLWTLARPAPARAQKIIDETVAQNKKIVLLTAHRRENAGAAVDEWFASLAQFLQAHPELYLIYPMHPNQAGHLAAQRHLAGLSNQVALMDAIDYGSACHLLRAATLVVTDSGGIQEEAATLGVPTVVCRKTTERSEAVDVGIARLAGLESASIITAMEWALNFDRKKYRAQFPFGDGSAGLKIAKALSL